jgi:hypothetical protein
MQRSYDPTQMDREMRMYAFPTMIAYGLRSHLTLMLRQAVVYQEMSMAGMTEKKTGFGDLFLLAKYKAYRVNTRQYTLGLAPTVGLEFPTGDESFSSDTWDLTTGLYISGRSGPWASDLNIAHAWNGFSGKGKNDIDPGEELSLDWALARQISLNGDATTALAPVLEVNYKHIWPDRLDRQDVSNTGESVLLISPGTKLTISSIVLEALVQIPVWQEAEGSQLERDAAALAGIRFLF